MDILKIAQWTMASKNNRIVRYEWEWEAEPTWDLDLEEIAKVYEEQDHKKNNISVKVDPAINKKDISAVTIYIDAWEFFDIKWVDRFEIIDVWNLRRNILFNIWDKFVWDKHLVKWLGDISNVDKIWQTEEVYDVDEHYVNDCDIVKFRKYFNPLTYQKCQWNINSENWN